MCASNWALYNRQLLLIIVVDIGIFFVQDSIGNLPEIYLPFLSIIYKPVHAEEIIIIIIHGLPLPPSPPLPLPQRTASIAGLVVTDSFH